MTRILRLPPRIKVLEALSAIADGRIQIDDNIAYVTSSDGSRRYLVIMDLNRRAVYSDDNGTIYRGYIGYPIIAYLMLKKILPFDERLANALKGIPWKRLNETYKRYAVVEDIVKKIAKDRGVEPTEIDKFVDEVMKKLSEMKLVFDEKLRDHLSAR